ncbi:MAG: radical SAM protein [Candidatus Falkowbacteria bacterium]
MADPVCLIIPPSGFLLDERVFMSLGILRVAAILEKSGIAVEVLDLSGISNYLEAAADHATATKTRIFGLTATTPQLPAAMATAKVIRDIQKNARMILGGPHVTLVNAAFKNNPDGRAKKALSEINDSFDVLVAGDGEFAIFEALRPDAPRIIDADNPKSPSGLFLNNKSLEKLPWPARHLVDVESYHYTIEGERALSIIAQLGCPFECGFCGGRNSPTFRQVRRRSSENIIREMVHLYRIYEVKGFMFYDDELNVSKNLVELTRLIANTQRDLNVEWKLRGFIKSEIFTNEQARAMREAGFRWILTGFESGSSQILKNINKKATREDNSRCIEIAHRHGLKVKALMSIGHPGESINTIQETEKWLLETKPDDFDVSIITVYPGTPYYDEAVPFDKPGIWAYTYAKTGDRLYQLDLNYANTANYYKGRPGGGYSAYVYTDFMSAEALVRERDRIERTVREKLGIPFNPSASATRYEYSMGQHGLSPLIFRVSK